MTTPLSAKTPALAYARYADSVKQVLGCVTSAHFISNVHPEPNRELVFAFTRNPSRLGSSPIALFFIQHLKVIPDEEHAGHWRVTTLSYEYNLERWDDRQEILCFHWEGAQGRRPDPHLHIGFAASGDPRWIGPKQHIPSGRIPIEDVVRFVIEEWSVSPLPARRGNWKSVVAMAKRLFLLRRSW